MSRLTYSASQLCGIVKQMLPSSENSEMAGTNVMTIGIVKNGKDEPCFYGHTLQPSWELTIVHPIATQQDVQTGKWEAICEPDNTFCVEVVTTDLEHALRSFGASDVVLSMSRETGNVLIATEESQVLLKGVVDMSPYDDNEEDKPEDKAAVVEDFSKVCQGLRTAIAVAGIRGNNMDKAGVHLHLEDSTLIIEGCNQRAIVCQELDCECQKMDMVISVESAKRLNNVLARCGSKELRIVNKSDLFTRFSCGSMVMWISLPQVSYRTCEDERNFSYPGSARLTRSILLKALYSLKALGEKEFSVSLDGSSLCLKGVTNAHAEQAVITLPCNVDGTITGIKEREYLLAPVIAALGNAYGCAEVTVEVTPDEWPMAVKAEKSSVFVN